MPWRAIVFQFGGMKHLEWWSRRLSACFRYFEQKASWMSLSKVELFAKIEPAKYRCKVPYFMYGAPNLTQGIQKHLFYKKHELIFNIPYLVSISLFIGHDLRMLELA